MRTSYVLIALLFGCACAEPTSAPAAEPPQAEVTPVRDAEPPAFPDDALLLASAPGRLDAAPRTVTLRWPQAATDEQGVIAYVVRLDGDEVARVDAPASQASLEGVAFESARTFAVVAVDAAGNESAPITTNDALSPWFPEGAEVEVERSGDVLTLTWPAAADDVAVSAYSIQAGEAELASLQPTTLRYRLPTTVEHTLTVVATDATGHKTRLAPSARLAVELASAQVERMLLGALGDQHRYEDVLAGGSVVSNTEDVLAAAEGVGVAEPEGTLQERRGLGTGDIGSLATSGGSGELVARPIRGSVSVSGPTAESGTGSFDAAIVTRQMRARQRAVQSCYERELRLTPTLAGRVTISFTLESAGTVIGASATENTTGSDAVAGCVTNTVRRFRFNPGPEGGSVRYTYAFDLAPQP